MNHTANHYFLYVLALIATLFSGQTFATTVHSTQDGNWMDPATWGGTLPDLYEDSIVIGHTVVLRQNITLEDAARLTILASGILQDWGNKALNLEPGTALYNAGEVLLFQIKNKGTIYNTGLIDLQGDLINHDGMIYNDAMIYTKNLLTQGGVLSGDGGQYMIWNNLNSTGETVATCTGEPINICNPDGVTDPCNGQGIFEPGCVTICGQLLDLELLSFEAKRDPVNAFVNLKWCMANQDGLGYFVMERTSGTTVHWITVSPKIFVVGPSVEGICTYRFTDRRPAIGYNLYRLVSVLDDGTRLYSDVIGTDVPMSQGVLTAPNPFTSQICLLGDLRGFERLEIIGLNGQVLFVHRGELIPCMEAPGLVDGWYILRLTGAQTEITIPVLRAQPEQQFRQPVF